jgi:hypothetical protein
MAATVVSSSLSASDWTKQKPAEYKGKELETALKGVEGLDSKKFAMPTKLSTVPKLKISEIETCITEMEADIVTLKKALAELKTSQASLQAVTSAANKTSSELLKMAKDKKASDDQKKKYENASQVALAIGSRASTTLGSIK